MKALQINKLQEWSDDNSLSKYIQALDVFSCGSTFLPCLAAARGKDRLVLQGACGVSWSCP